MQRDLTDSTVPRNAGVGLGNSLLACKSVLQGIVKLQDSDALDMSTSYRSFSSKLNVCWGWIFVVLGSVSFLGFFYAAILSKLLPPSGNQIMSAIQNDRYYCLLVPLTLPVLVVAVYFHWLSMKLFKHA
ncbi:uncharacterized protein LOC122671020 [Telopea speciosissima]|uniref:uncharacterized protein LOC122671020 n=1 Tax=Telopea speciosissima TaxID=54955 RepID=UPI001CC6890C|nr:uncharacterized protein LOC122671020 [Telopea speciosissima]XP_043724035.1 uncharacterized protein LOC122671020 [Telopea speciosissima]XP_043724036.1 uncharacterized protein LOC122671020 [Telopea speciosissima]